jgi:hypothetical protein
LFSLGSVNDGNPFRVGPYFPWCGPTSAVVVGNAMYGKFRFGGAANDAIIDWLNKAPHAFGQD